MKVVVTGGSGALGAEVVRKVRQGYGEVVAASRRTGVDLATGAGLAGALDGAEVIVHAASDPRRYRKVDLDGTRRIVSILQQRRLRPHLVYVSIVGCDQNPYPYYRAKYACELVLARSDLPVTVVRATQFHTLVAAIAHGVTRGGVAFVPRMTFQPCDHLWVAAEIARIALGEPPRAYGRSDDLAGPEQVTLEDAVRRLRARAGRPEPRIVPIPAVGGALKAFAAGTNLPGPEARTGGSSFTEWLAQR